MGLFRTSDTGQPVNIDLLSAVVAFTFRAAPDTYIEVARHSLQGDLLVDVTGTDPHLPRGERVMLRAAAAGIDGVPAYLSPDAVLQTHPKKTSLANLEIERVATLDLLALVASSEASGIRIEAGRKFGKAAIDAEYVGRMLSFSSNVAVKSALSSDADFDPAATNEVRAQRRLARVIDALAATIDDDLYFATLQGVDEDGNAQVLNYRTTSPAPGENYLLAFTSPLEVAARNPNDAFNAITVRETLRLVREDPDVAGIVLNAASPYLQLTRADLAPLL